HLLLCHQPALLSCVRIHQDRFEQVFEPASEVLNQLLLKLRAGMTCTALDGGDVVLADAEVVGQLELRETALFAHRLQPRRADFDLQEASLARRVLFASSDDSVTSGS